MNPPPPSSSSPPPEATSVFDHPRDNLCIYTYTHIHFFFLPFLKQLVANCVHNSCILLSSLNVFSGMFHQAHNLIGANKRDLLGILVREDSSGFNAKEV